MDRRQGSTRPKPTSSRSQSADYEKLTLHADGHFGYEVAGISGDGGGICGTLWESSGKGTWRVDTAQGAAELVLTGSFYFDDEPGYDTGTAFDGEYCCGPLPATRDPGPLATDCGSARTEAWRQWRPTEEFLPQPPNARAELAAVSEAMADNDM